MKLVHITIAIACVLFILSMILLCYLGFFKMPGNEHYTNNGGTIEDQKQLLLQELLSTDMIPKCWSKKSQDVEKIKKTIDGMEEPDFLETTKKIRDFVGYLIFTDSDTNLHARENKKLLKDAGYVYEKTRYFTKKNYSASALWDVIYIWIDLEKAKCG